MDQDKYLYMGEIIEKIHASVTIADANGTYVFAGSGCEEIFGVDPEQIIGKNVNDTFIASTFQPCITKLVLDKKEKIVSLQKNKNGKQTLVTGVPLFDEKNELELIIVISSWEAVSYEELQNKYDDLEDEVLRLNQVIKHRSNEGSLAFNILENSRMFQNLERLLGIFCENKLSAFIVGPNGSGRKYLARKAYEKNGLVFEYNCELLEEETIENDLFGEAGLLTYAKNRTVIIDNIENLSPVLQKKLVDELTDQKAVVVAVSETSLEQLRASGKIVKEFYYFFHSYQVKVDPLCERLEDLQELINYYLAYYNKKYARNITFSTKAMSALMSYEWVENISEVRTVIERIVLSSEQSRVDFYDLPDSISKQSFDVFANQETLKDMLDHYERMIIARTYDKYKTTVAVAKHLGISQPSAARKIQKYVKDAE